MSIQHLKVEANANEMKKMKKNQKLWRRTRKIHTSRQKAQFVLLVRSSSSFFVRMHSNEGTVVENSSIWGHITTKEP